MQRMDETDPNKAVVPDEVLLDLTCPSCGADLLDDDAFLNYRVCGGCQRHFGLSARERVTLLVDSGRFDELRVSLSPVADDGTGDLASPSRSSAHHDSQVIGEAIVTGVGRIAGIDVTVIALDDHLVGAALGALMTDKVILALDHATSNHLPVVMICAGNQAVSTGPLAILQGARLASAFAQVHLAGLAVIGVLVHPVSSSIVSTIGAHADVLIAEPGLQVSSTQAGFDEAAQRTMASDLLAGGWVDAVCPRAQLPALIGTALDLICNAHASRITTIVGHRPFWLRNGPREATGDDLVLEQRLFDSWLALRGDRVTGDDPAVRGGIGRIEGSTVVAAIVDAKEQAAGAAGARKIVRLARLAGRLELPLVLMIDAVQVSPARSFDPELAAASSALSAMLPMMPVPVIAIGLNDIGGWLAPCLMGGDRLFLAGQASITVARSHPGSLPGPRPQSRFGDSQATLSAAMGVRLGMVDGVIQPPDDDLAGAVRSMIRDALAELAGISSRRLVDSRQRKIRAMGQSTPEGVAAARHEMWELQEWQKSVGKSIDDLRERWEHIRASQPRVSLQRPDISELAARLRARRAELIERARHAGDRLS